MLFLQVCCVIMIINFVSWIPTICKHDSSDIKGFWHPGAKECHKVTLNNKPAQRVYWEGKIPGEWRLCLGKKQQGNGQKVGLVVSTFQGETFQGGEISHPGLGF